MSSALTALTKMSSARGMITLHTNTKNAIHQNPSRHKNHAPFSMVVELCREKNSKVMRGSTLAGTNKTKPDSAYTKVLFGKLGK